MYSNLLKIHIEMGENTFYAKRPILAIFRKTSSNSSAKRCVDLEFGLHLQFLQYYTVVTQKDAVQQNISSYGPI